jgi:hypothetical protein
MTIPLGHRHRHAATTLRHDIDALRAALHERRPPGTVSEYSMNLLKDTVSRANRVFAREAGLPRFRFIDRGRPLSAADITILIHRLAAAMDTFDRRHGEAEDDWDDFEAE